MCDSLMLNKLSVCCVNLRFCFSGCETNALHFQMNESIHRASPVHSQQEYIDTGLALYKNNLPCIVKWGILAQG